MNILVTAGNTWAPIDKVRVITNIFTGRTGTAIALEAYRRGHTVSLFTSHPKLVEEMGGDEKRADRWLTLAYATFEDLEDLFESANDLVDFDAVIHSAAVSDYLAGGVYAAEPGSSFDAVSGEWTSGTDGVRFLPKKGGKVKSDEAELWLRLVRAPKLVDKIRRVWRFNKILVKFKLEVDIDEKTLLERAEHSRLESAADLMVANTLENAHRWALIGGRTASYECVQRDALASRLLDLVEQLHKERTNG